MKIASHKSGLARQSETDAQTMQFHHEEEDKDQEDALVENLQSRASGTEAYESRETLQGFLD